MVKLRLLGGGRFRRPRTFSQRVKVLNQLKKSTAAMRIKKKKSREWRRAYGTPTPHLTAVLHAVDNTGASDPVPRCLVSHVCTMLSNMFSRNPLLWNKILLDGENLLLEMKHKLYLEDGSKHSKSLTMTIASNEREIQVLEAAQKMLWSNAIANDMRGVSVCNLALQID
eukprot:762822-Hanusia_phi.AAC.8